MADNVLYYGDNLDVLRRHIKDESIDLVYLDPPFKSDQTYNVLFAAKDGTEAAAQIQAFEDTWHWDQAAAKEFEEAVEQGGKVSEVLQAFRLFLGTNDMLAYLTMMAPRLVELRRVLKETGCLYLHCDPTASHYLKLLLDAVFGVRAFRNEIIWKRSSAHSDTRQGARHYGRVSDTIPFYAKGDENTWWALGLVGARGTEQKKGADQGIDGRLYFHLGDNKTRHLIISVKAGKVQVSHVRDLEGVIGREKAEIGVLLSFEEPTRPMREEAASAGFYDSPWGKHPRIQLLTVADLLAGKSIDYPRTAGTNVTLKAAPRVYKDEPEPPHLFDVSDEPKLQHLPRKRRGR